MDLSSKCIKCDYTNGLTCKLSSKPLVCATHYYKSMDKCHHCKKDSTHCDIACTSSGFFNHTVTVNTTTTKSCAPCKAGALSCNNTLIDTKCDHGYHMNGTLSCVKCSSDSVSECNITVTASACSKGFFHF